MQALPLMDVVRYAYAIDYTAKDRNIKVTSVEFDSRKVKPGALFVPLTGGRTDGHDYIQQAIDNGAVATLWSKDQESAPSDQIATVFVDDTLDSMQRIASYYRDLINPIVIGITGSNGKTTTKDMTAMTLQAKYKVHATKGNYNNEIGLPYTILKMPEDTQVLVLEMGMSDFGEIEFLSKLAKPDIAAITLIGESHLEHLGSRLGIAQAKLEIVKGLKGNGVLIYPEGEPLISKAMPEVSEPIYLRSFGFSPDADVYAKDIFEEKDRTYFSTNIDDQVICMIPVLGRYNISNALVALSIAEVLDVPIEQAIFQLSQFKLTKNRLEWMETKQGAQLLNDAYNASPTSMKAVLGSFSDIELEEGQVRSAVLGDILELGEESSYYHKSLADSLNPEKIEKVYLFGTQMKDLYDELLKKYDESALFYEENSHERLLNKLEENLTKDDVILMKSSFGMDLLSIVSALTEGE